MICVLCVIEGSRLPVLSSLVFDCLAQAVFSRKFSEARQRVTVLTDERVKLTNQAVTGARLMKINAWEPALETEIRRQEA